MSDHLPGPVPEVPVVDLNSSVEYYRDRFGFSLDWSEDGIGLAGISRGSCRLFLANAEYRSHRGNSAPIVIWLNLDSIDAVNDLHSDWRDRGATIVAVPESKPYGLHEFRSADLAGNVFRVFYDFATPEREGK